MKPWILKSVIAGVVLVLVLGFSACKTKKQAAETKSSTSTAPELPSPPPPQTRPSEEGEVKPLSPEEFWKIHLARLEVIRDFWKKQLEIYEKYNGPTPEARKEIRELQESLRGELQSLFAKLGVAQRQFFASNPEERQARDKYRQDHPEINEKFSSINQEIRDLRIKVRKLLGAKNPEPPAAPPASQPPANPGAPTHP